jgi:hypothetical protein
MTKNDKIKAIQAIKEGRLFLSDLVPKANGCFLKHEGRYYNNGQEYSENEFKEWLKGFELQNERRKNAGLIEEIIMIII